MKKIIPIADLQRQAGQVLNGSTNSDEPIIISQYTHIEKDLERLDELELLEMVKASREAQAAGHTISHLEVKKHLGFTSEPYLNELSSRNP
ncbi:MAG: hypothetical protein ACRD4L_06935 [Pyrinomonadaceae bacterium]